MVTQKILPKLIIEHSSVYKMIISEEVERKIRYLCSKISTIEWSGILFYTYSGSFADDDLTIHCVDIFPMDIGNSGYTEFDMSPDAIAYMTENNLLDCQVGLIHSHHGMQAYFSGTDLNTLQSEGNDRNHFVSLIVNNAGQYVAAITKKLKTKSTITTNYTYNTFEDEIKTGNCIQEDVEEEIIQYNMLKIEKANVSNPFLFIDERLQEIKTLKEKAKTKTKTTIPAYTSPAYNTYKKTSDYIADDYGQDYYDWYNYYGNAKYKSGMKDVQKANKKTNDLPPKELVDTIVLQLITGSIIIKNTSKIDPATWVKQMPDLYSKVFPTMSLYKTWVETFVEFIFADYVLQKVNVDDADVDTFISKLCKEVYNKLRALPSNAYIDTIKDNIELWIIPE